MIATPASVISVSYTHLPSRSSSATFAMTLTRAVPPPATIPSSTAARVALRAVSYTHLSDALSVHDLLLLLRESFGSAV